MKLIIGLGNPGDRYLATRHNLGARLVDLLAKELGQGQVVWRRWRSLVRLATFTINGERLHLAIPLCFMNESGSAVAPLWHWLKLQPSDLWVTHDELDLPFGDIRLSQGGSAAGHRGVASILEAVGTPNFWRWRLGIGRPPPDSTAERFVLESFNDQEIQQLSSFLTRACNEVTNTLKQGLATRE